MRELSLFTGVGGGVLGTSLLGWTPVGYVEWDNYCQQILAQRIKDGLLTEAPIYGDIKTFNSEGYAERYRGMVDVVTGGFPCQPFSVAGKQEASADIRNMWPETIRCIRIVHPRWCLLENVAGLLSRSHGYFETILKDLAESGYDAKWKVVSAAEVGAPHKRDRLWILANADITKPSRLSSGTPEAHAGTGINSEDVANADPQGLQGDQRTRGSDTQGWQEPDGSASQCSSLSGREGWWATEPALGRVAHGVANRVDRLKAIGNGQVPSVVRAVWELMGGECQ